MGGVPERFYVVYWTEGTEPEGCRSFGSEAAAVGWAEGFGDGARKYAGSGYGLVYLSEEWASDVKHGGLSVEDWTAAESMVARCMKGGV